MNSAFTWEIVIARIKARRDARAETGFNVANLDSLLEKMGRRDKKWADDAYATPFVDEDSHDLGDRAMSDALDLVVSLERLHTLRPSLRARMLADEAARLAERVNLLVSESGGQDGSTC